MRSILIILSSMILILPGCEKDSEVPNNEGSVEAVALATFSGMWASECTYERHNNLYVRDTYKFDSSAGTLERGWEEYLDEDCRHLISVPSPLKGEFKLRRDEDSIDNVFSHTYEETYAGLSFFHTYWYKIKKVDNQFKISEALEDSNLGSPSEFLEKLDSLEFKSSLLRADEIEKNKQEFIANLPEKNTILDEGKYQTDEALLCEYLPEPVWKQPIVRIGYPNKEYEKIFFVCRAHGYDEVFRFKCPKDNRSCENVDSSDKPLRYVLIQNSSTQFTIKDIINGFSSTFNKIEPSQGENQ